MKRGADRRVGHHHHPQFPDHRIDHRRTGGHHHWIIETFKSTVSPTTDGSSINLEDVKDVLCAPQLVTQPTAK